MGSSQWLHIPDGAPVWADHAHWARRQRLIGLLEWLAALGAAEGMQVWAADSEAARLLAGRLRNDEA